MRKIKWILSLSLFAMSIIVTAQSKVQKENAKAFSVAYATKFKISEVIQTNVYELQLEKLKKNKQLNKQVKAGELSKDEKKIQSKANNKKFITKLTKISGVTRKEIVQFLRAKSWRKKK